MSQGSTVLPTTGIFSGLQEQDFINAALAALVSNFSGPSAPTSPTLYQFWVDTSVADKGTLNWFNGTVWTPYLTIDLTSGAITFVGGLPALGLGSMAAENIGASGMGLADDGHGNARVVFPWTNVSTNQTPASSNHLTRYAVTGPVTFTLGRANTFFNGYGFEVKVESGTATFSPSSPDVIWAGAEGSAGASLTVAAPASVFISTDGGASGNWYADVIYPSALSGYGIQKSSSYSVQPTDNGLTHYLTGTSSFTVSVAAASGFPNAFKIRFYNQSSRGILLNVNSITAFYLYPGQSTVLENDGSGWNLSPLVQRYIPSAATTLYVDGAIGSDSNDGIAPGSGGAFGTIQNALNVARANFDVLGVGLTIDISDLTLFSGTYNVGAGVNLNYIMPLRDVQIVGNPASPADVVVSCSAGGTCFSARDGNSTATLGSMTLSTTGNGSTLLSVSQSAVVDLGDLNDVNFNAAPLGNHLIASTWASINFLAGYEIFGNATNHLVSENNGYINYGSFLVTGVSNLTFGTFAVASNCGVINSGGVAMTFSGFGAVTGTKYLASMNGVINSNSTNYPGSTAGSTSNGGQYA